MPAANLTDSADSEIAAYLHIPFCARKCGYCDFNAYSGYKDGTKARYVEAICREIEARAEPQTRIPTIFFGGGTPTQLPAQDLRRILHTLKASFHVDNDAEITVEANPGDADPHYLAALREAGFNRLSFGVQTFDDRLLRTIDRLHTGADAEAALRAARAAGFDNLSLDLMFALPRQTMAAWERSLDRALALDVPHLSMYALILEEGTPFHARLERGRLPALPPEKLEAAMFTVAIERAEAAGYRHYEIGNYARPGYECRHNAVYWRNEPYFGFGAGAVEYRERIRRRNVDRPSQYIETVLSGDGTAHNWEESLSQEETMGETIMVGLRMTEGVDLAAFQRRFGVDPEMHYANIITRNIELGLLERAEGHLRLTRPRGLFFGSEVMASFLA